MKAFVFIFTAIVQLACAALAFFMLLVGLNGFSEKDAVPSLIFYIVLALASAAGVGLSSVYLTKRLAETSVGIYGAAAIAAVASVLFGIIILIIGWFAALFLAQIIREWK
jgi:hypothetical protein